MARFSKNDLMRAKHLNPDSISFSVFTAADVEKMSVMKIRTPLTFDALGHPLEGGLYDRALGPSGEKNELCTTCFKNSQFCPGHFGYIDLPLPAVNPVFHKTIYMILRMACFNCFQLQLSGDIKYCLSIQMRLLNRGLITEANEIECKIQDLIATNKSLKNIGEEDRMILEYYESIAKEYAGAGEVMMNKNIEAMRATFVDSKVRTIKSNKLCMHCSHPWTRVNTLKNRIRIDLLKATTESPNKSVVGRVSSKLMKYINPEESRGYMRSIWENESDFLVELVPVLKNVACEYPTDVFYFENVPVVPPCVRPINVVAGRMMEHEQTHLYKDILQTCMLLRLVIAVVQHDGDTDVIPMESKGAYNLAPGKTPIEKLNNAWETLQLNVDCVIDKENSGRNATGEGLKQIIEKKEGMIRMHMMGKRVNFSARSVITPDPNLNIDEIGIPEEFAKKLTYPVPVTSWNVTELRKMILNGPYIHPGAVQVEYENGSIIRINPNDKTQNESIIKRLLTPDDKEKGFTGVKRVHRHLCNGDILLLNRQPTLHKPSIMAHKARILKGERTLRLHYANCKAYNADFDGDEMNAHFPQNELARSEGYTLANVSNQYLVPKDGTPLSGLIQDHVISGVKMSLRGRFFTKDDYHQLVFQALAHKTGEIALLPPAIVKPAVLWSGKQVLSTVIVNIIPKGMQPINLTSTAKINPRAWQKQPSREWKAGGTPFKDDRTMSEGEVVIRNGELLIGVLDKTHYGATPYGLVHCMYELYGGAYATKLLSSFAKLFTYFLQWEGFTLGVHDILVQDAANRKRRKIIKNARKIGPQAIASALDVSPDTPVEDMVEKLAEASFRNAKMRAIVDREYKSALDSFTNSINKTCLPAGLICKFPENNLQLMVQSGAKGSTVNTMQISCLLGQIELEGKRPPVMISGKSLPSFPAFEFAPRAGGFIDGRFMTGIQPQEFFFHCMAGREGLIDTAVKTSRSGYLQRCLIKHLEGLTVGYDLTVRDSDRSVIQFLYGEDGMDVSKAQFLNAKQMKFLSENSKAIVDRTAIENIQSEEEGAKLADHIANLVSWKAKHGDPLRKLHRSPFTVFSAYVKEKLDVGKKAKVKNGRDKLARRTVELWQSADAEVKDAFRKECRACPDPLNAALQPDVYYGSLTDHLSSLMDNHTSGKKKKARKEFEHMLKFKSMQSLCDPGEPVGLLAAQSVGEPSTQMTLNTFHFAGRGEMNVTLGIPRLREILMMASKNLKTPSMEIPFLDVPDLEKEADKLRKALTRVTVADVLEKIEVTGTLELGLTRQMVYELKFSFLPQDLYKSKYNVKPRMILKHMTRVFFKQMFQTLKKHTKVNTHVVAIDKDKEQKENEAADEAEGEVPRGKPQNEESDDDDEVEDAEDAKLTSKFEQSHDTQEPEEEEGVALDNEENEAEEKDDEGEEADVVSSYNFAQNYIYDRKKHLWCTLTFAIPLSQKKADLTAILKEVANKSVVWETPSIKRAITYMKDDRLTLRTDGINIIEMFKYNKLLDLNKLYTNDVHKVAETYGIEAAVKVIVKEIQEVFKVYGITVDPRHLLLIADYMAFNGSFEPLNRMGLANSASPLQQMSFEASLNFLRVATIQGKHDQLQSPSSCLMLGKPCHTGTGSFTLMNKLPLVK